MRWFTDEAYETDDDEAWDRMLADYAAYIDSIVDRLPSDLAKLATDPRLNLHDALVREVRVDPNLRIVEMVVVLGDLQSRYFKLKMRFRDARVVPENYQKLEYALSAAYGTGRWGSVRTEILAHEVEALPDGRFLLRLRLWPFHEFGIEFGALSLEEADARSVSRDRPGRFVLARRRRQS